MAAPVVAVIGKKLAQSFLIRYWKEILVGIIALNVVTFFIPLVAVLALLPDLDDLRLLQYKNVAYQYELDWIDMVSFDTVRYDNDMALADPEATAYDFFKLSYTRYKKQETVITSNLSKVEGGTVYYWVDVDGTRKWYTLAGVIDQIKAGKTATFISTTSVSTSWSASDSEVLSGFTSIFNFLSSTGFNPNAYQDPTSGMPSSMFLNMITHISNLDNSNEYDVSLEKLTLLDLSSNFDVNEQDWLFTLLQTLNEDEGNYIAYEFNPVDSAYLESVVIDPNAFQVADIAISLTGDLDANSVLLGRVAFMIQDLGQVKINIISGYRSNAEQERLWYSYPPEKRGTYVAAPGTSRHNYGLAIDVEGWLTSVPNSVLINYGIYKPMSHENWHIEPVETSLDLAG